MKEKRKAPEGANQTTRSKYTNNSQINEANSEKLIIPIFSEIEPGNSSTKRLKDSEITCRNMNTSFAGIRAKESPINLPVSLFISVNKGLKSELMQRINNRLYGRIDMRAVENFREYDKKLKKIANTGVISL